MIKKWLKRRRLKKKVEIEVLETLCSLMKYYECEAYYSPRGRNGYYSFHSHFRMLKGFSEELREMDNKKPHKPHKD